MLYLLAKAAISGALVAAASEIAKRYPGLGGLIASLPLISVLGMIWLWRDTRNVEQLASHSTGAFWFVLPSLPMFLIIPAILRKGGGFPLALGAGCGATLALYLVMIGVGPRFGLRL